jgi:carbon monoxide dehydrogenase subunit G
MPELDHTYPLQKSAEQTFAAITDLDRVVPAVEGGKVLERTGEDSAKAEILVAMGAMSLRFVGTVEVVEKDPSAHRAVLRVKSREAQGQGFANADVTFTMNGSEGNVHTSAQINGKAASMGEGVMVTVLDALIKDFASKLPAL